MVRECVESCEVRGGRMMFWRHLPFLIVVTECCAKRQWGAEVVAAAYMDDLGPQGLHTFLSRRRRVSHTWLGRMGRCGPGCAALQRGVRVVMLPTSCIHG